MNRSSKTNFILHDISIIALSIVMAVVIIKTHVLEDLLKSTVEWRLLGSFISGMFFTSIFTTAPAIVALGEISHSNSVLATAFFGALGAVIGDMVIFRFVRDGLSDHFLELVRHQGLWKRTGALFKLKYFRWITFLVGGLIIASPFPDELGISLLGLSKMKTPLFILISFFFNFIGILIIGVVAVTL